MRLGMGGNEIWNGMGMRFGMVWEWDLEWCGNEIWNGVGMGFGMVWE